MNLFSVSGSNQIDVPVNPLWPIDLIERDFPPELRNDEFNLKPMLL